MPLIVPNFIALGQTMHEKSVTKLFYTLSILMLQKDPVSQSSLIFVLMYFVPF